jgi:hypothetical protein
MWRTHIKLLTSDANTSFDMLSIAGDELVSQALFAYLLAKRFRCCSYTRISEMVRHYCRMSNIKTLRMGRIGPIVEPFQEAFEQVRDRFNAIPGLRREGKRRRGRGSCAGFPGAGSSGEMIGDAQD